LFKLFCHICLFCNIVIRNVYSILLYSAQVNKIFSLKSNALKNSLSFTTPSWRGWNIIQHVGSARTHATQSMCIDFILPYNIQYTCICVSGKPCAVCNQYVTMGTTSTKRVTTAARRRTEGL